MSLLVKNIIFLFLPKGINQWSERQRNVYEERRPRSPSPVRFQDRASPRFQERTSPRYHQDRSSPTPVVDYIQRDYQWSPKPDYHQKPVTQRITPVTYQSERQLTTPTPPQRKKAIEKRSQRLHETRLDSRLDSGYRTLSRNERRLSRDEPLEEPPPDYSPPSPPPMPDSYESTKKQQQKTRFSEETSTIIPKQKGSGNIIGKYYQT